MQYVIVICVKFVHYSIYVTFYVTINSILVNYNVNCASAVLSCTKAIPQDVTFSGIAHQPFLNEVTF